MGRVVDRWLELASAGVSVRRSLEILRLERGNETETDGIGSSEKLAQPAAGETGILGEPGRTELLLECGRDVVDEERACRDSLNLRADNLLDPVSAAG